MKNNNVIFTEMNELIENSNVSYFDKYKEDVLEDIKLNRERLLSGSQEDVEEYELGIELEYDYNSRIYEANIIPEELQYDDNNTFTIGNNLRGGI